MKGDIVPLLFYCLPACLHAKSIFQIGLRQRLCRSQPGFLEEKNNSKDPYILTDAGYVRVHHSRRMARDVSSNVVYSILV